MSTILLPLLLHTQPENYEYQLSELHKAKAGYTPAQARAEFCDIARRLIRYGFHLFGAQVSPVFQVRGCVNCIHIRIIIGSLFGCM